MKKMIAFLTALVLALGLCACTAAQSEDPAPEVSQGPTWQEQYDLGIRYLSEGNYEEAIIAFTAAIEIDPKQALAYVGRGDAYVGSGETETNLDAAKADYEKSIELDETSADAYLGLVDVYVRQGEYKKALDILKRGLKITGNRALEEKLHELEEVSFSTEEIDSNGLNSHGAVAFTLREEFVPFLELLPDEQRLIQQTIDSVMQGDREALLALAADVSSIADKYHADKSAYRMSLNTVCKGYKIGLSSFHTGNYIEGADTEYCYRIEFRPENGLGYYADVVNRELIAADLLPNSDGYCEFYCHGVKLVTCPCKGWQWNGEMKGHEHIERSQRFDTSDSSIEKNTSDTQEVGEMKDSLREGEFVFSWKSVGENVNEAIEVTLGSDQWFERYSGGICIEEIPHRAVRGEGWFYDLGASCGIRGTSQTFHDDIKWLYW